MNQPIVVSIKRNPIVVKMSAPITVVLATNKIIIQGNFSIMNFVSFSFTCDTQGQTVFGPLPITPQAIWLYINGTAQNQTNGDFSISGPNIILNSGIDIGDIVYGVIQL